MRKFTLASLLVVLGSGSLLFACNGDGDDGADNDGSGGTSTGGSGQGGDTSTGGTSGSDDVCADDGARGTTVGEGTCAKLIDFETDFTLGYASDNRNGTGLDMNGDEPRLSGGANASGTGSLVQADEGADGTSKSAHFTFTGAETWGGSFSMLISNNECYDASTYTGIQFWAKAAEGSNTDIFVGVGTAETNPLYNCSPEIDCYNSGRKSFTLTTEWALYTATWDELVKPNWGTNWGTNTDSTKDRLVSISFSDAGAEATNDIEFYVDEVSFTGGDDSACSPVGGGGASGE